MQVELGLLERKAAVARFRGGNGDKKATSGHCRSTSQPVSRAVGGGQRIDECGEHATRGHGASKAYELVGRLEG